MFRENLGRSAERAGGFGHVVHQKDIAAFDFTDHVHCFDSGRADPVFRHDGELRSQCVRIGAGHFHAADVRRDDGEVGGVRVAFLQVTE